MVTQFYLLILGTLAVWRVTHFLNAEDGPWDLSFRLRRLAGNGFFGGLLDCFYCLSLWTSAPLAYVIGNNFAERLLLWPALSAGAILLQRITPDKAADETPHPTASQTDSPEDQEEWDLLWEEPPLRNPDAAPVARSGFLRSRLIGRS